MRKKKNVPNKETDMNSIANSAVTIQTSSQSMPSTPSWFGEVTVIVSHLAHQGVLAEISEQVRFARRRFGHYEVIDFLAVLFGYAISGERTLEAFYERLSRLCGDLHGLVQPRAVAQPLGAQSLSCQLHPGGCRSPACALSGGSTRPPAHQRAAERRVAGSNERRVGGLRHRWHPRGGPPTRLAEDGGPAPCSASPG